MKSTPSSRPCVRLCAAIAAILAAVGAIFGSLMLFLNYDAGVGYFKSNAVTVIFTLFYVGGVIWLLLSAIIAKQDRSSETPTNGKLNGVFDLIAAATAIATSVVWALLYFVGSRSNAISIVTVICGILSALYFASHFFRARRSAPSASVAALLGFATVLWLISIVAYMHFDNFVTMNSPIKTLLVFGLAAAMFATLADVRRLIGRHIPRYSLSAHSITLFCGCASSIPVILYGIISPISDPHYTAAALTVLGLSALSGARLYTIAHGACSISSDTRTEPTADIQEERTEQCE
ncbi:MAG: hypothetical protein E7589_02450 [Ruminococcaceae bacterium]|nr:hypothetical protein [Oscillospiraceae bacterium]